MIRTTLTAAALTLAASPFALAQESEQRWFADYDEALAIAKTEGKDLLVDFTGSDWCGWCIRLHDEVFKHDSWYDVASESYVLVALDFPNAAEIKAKVPNPERNAELRDQYGVRGYPTILLMNVEGEVFGRTGYQAGGPEAYVTHMTSLASSGKKMLAAAKEIESEYADAEDKAAVVRKAIGLLQEAEDGAPGLSVIASVARKAYELDPKNKSGLKKEALVGLLNSGVAEEQEFKLAIAMDPKNEEGLHEQVIVAQGQSVSDKDGASAFVEALIAFKKLEKVHDQEMVGSLALSAGMWCMNENLLNRPEDGKSLLKWADAMGQIPAEMKEQITEQLGDIL